MIYAIKTRTGNWFLVKKAKAEAYSEPNVNGLNLPADTDVWSEIGTTAWCGIVGEEEKCVELES